MPGHFVAACSTPAGPLFIDAFNGGAELSPENCAQLVQKMTAQTLVFEAAWLNETSAEDTLVRMLNNLRQAYVNRREWNLALKVVDQLQVLHPARAAHWRTRGFIHLQAGELGAALRALEQFLCRAPSGSDAQVIRNACNQIRNSIARLN
jgi:regulator of sirC expression with transglutaminase-like and TPR domain